MGMEYQEFRIKIRNKKSGKIIEIKQQMVCPNGKLLTKKDFEFVDLDVVYG